MSFHPIRDPAPLVTTSRMVFWVALLAFAAILGSLKAPWWQVGLAFVLVWAVRVTARWEVL